MLENELKNIWKNSSMEELVKFNKSKLILDLDSKLEDFEKKMKFRDKKLLVWGILVIIGLIYLFFSEPELISRIIFSLYSLTDGIGILSTKTLKYLCPFSPRADAIKGKYHFVILELSRLVKYSLF